VQPALSEDLLVRVCSYITDPVTTTDELIPSGETSSYRSNPERLSEFTLFRKDPGYVARCKEVRAIEHARAAGGELPAEVKKVYEALAKTVPADPAHTNIGSVLFAVKPGDGSAREQAASCQRVIGGLANITREYATKRYRSNVMNWGMLPFQLEGEPPFEVGDYIFVPNVRAVLDGDLSRVPAYVIRHGRAEPLPLFIADMTPDERAIVKAGCLINFNRNRK
jgi:aconitate hydratase